MKKVVAQFDRVVSIRPGIVLGSLLCIWPIIFVCFFQYTCLKHDYSLVSSIRNFGSFLSYFFKVYANPLNVSLRTVKYLLLWYTFQVFLYMFVPGRVANGRLMRSGRSLDYCCNGLSALLISNALVIVLGISGLIDVTYFVDRMQEFLILSNYFGIFLAVFVYLKGLFAPNCDLDCFYSGSSFYDFYCGIEHSPRLGKFDFKQFFNERVGIALWPLINLSYACKMYQLHGTVTYSMMVLNILQFLYVFDLFYNEDWYMKTIDIAHDHFGFYLAWGDIVWLPFMYTLQGFYLMAHPAKISLISAGLILFFGLCSIYMFRKSNNQKDEFRNAKALGKEYYIFDREAKYIEANYTLQDDTVRKSYLLTDGYWGISRHFNYLTDLGNSLSYSLCCGFGCLLPYFYFIYMLILLLHRIERDNIRCQAKYGERWELYCQRVPYKMIPYIY